MAENHIPIEKLSYCEPVKEWLTERYGAKEADAIWNKVVENYNSYLAEMEDVGGKKSNHAKAIYGGLLVFALYPALPDQPPISELSDFINHMFFGPFVKLGKVFDLNRSLDMALINKVFENSGNRDRKDIRKYPTGFINVGKPYDKENKVASYNFTQCPNAEFAKKHNLLHVLPLLCNSDFFAMEQVHGRLIRCGTCGNSDLCDYRVVGNKNPLAQKYEIETDDGGFLVSRERGDVK